MAVPRARAHRGLLHGLPAGPCEPAGCPRRPRRLSLWLLWSLFEDFQATPGGKNGRYLRSREAASLLGAAGVPSLPG